VVPFESLGTVFYLFFYLFAFHSNYGGMAVCLAISEIFSVIQWRDLRNQVRGRSRSLKMSPFDSATFYSSAIVNIAISYTIFEFFYVEQYRDLEVGVRGHSLSLKLVPFKSLHTISYFCGRIYSRL